MKKKYLAYCLALSMALTAVAPVAAAEPVDIVVEDDSEDTAVDFAEDNEEADVAEEDTEDVEDTDDEIYPVIRRDSTDFVSTDTLEKRASLFILLAVPAKEGLTYVLDQIAVVGNQNTVALGFQSLLQKFGGSVFTVLGFTRNANDFHSATLLPFLPQDFFSRQNPKYSHFGIK